MTCRSFLSALAATLLAAVVTLAGPARAQSIDNIASATWMMDGEKRSVVSNKVSLTREAPAAADIAAFRIAPSTAQTVVAGPARCPSAGTSSAVTTAAQSLSVAPLTDLRPGEGLVVRIAAPLANLDPQGIDIIEVELTTSGGERELVQLRETSASSGVFAAVITTAVRGASIVAGDCKLSAAAGDKVHISYRYGTDPAAVVALDLGVLADPYGLVFDSVDGSPVDGARVSLVDAASGAPARVFADDGVTPWPSTVVSGQTITDAAGKRYPMPAGEYRFPLAPLGNYRIVVEPPSPYLAPSRASPAQLAGFLRPDGLPVETAPASFGGVLVLASPAPVRVDIPVDRLRDALGLEKTASLAVAAAGDTVFYTLVVRNPDGAARQGVSLADSASKDLRFAPGSLRVDGVTPMAGSLQADADGSGFVLSLGALPARAVRKVTYAMRLRAGARPGRAANRAVLRDGAGNESRAGADLIVQGEVIAARMTLVGRVTAGDCSARSRGEGIPGVRVTLEDGSYAITDAEGRYHFEGLVPGTHVAQAQAATLPGQGSHFVDCADSTRSAGSATSRFVSGRGGSLAVADFFAVVGELPAARATAAPLLDDTAAAGGKTDFLALGDGPIDWLFPAADHNPRARAVRVAIRHRPGQTVALSAGGSPVDALAYDGVRTDPTASYAVSVWRGVPLAGDETVLAATVRNADGSVAAELTRAVHFAANPARVEIVEGRSRLVADGVTKPVLAVRLVDRAGRPVHAGMAGEFAIGAPYESAQALADLQLRQLSGIATSTPRWIVQGDDGIALIELAPTMVSGALHVRFAFPDGNIRREQTLDAWVVPGEQKWTLVGLAEGALGSQTVAEAMEREGQFDSDLGDRARVAFYAKGRVLGQVLLTVAYDSAKQRDDQRLLGTIDPRAYYTVFADSSDRRFDAASRQKLYVRLESRAFYALYGDFEAGFDQSELARYHRTATGVKAEAQLGALRAAAFATNTAMAHRRDEFQGNGLSGPYRLSSRSIIPNSETVRIEVRDRLRSELVLERKTLTRFIDYDIDLLSGTITFSQPLASRDFALNPQFAVVDFETEGDGDRALTAGARADWMAAGGALRVGGTVLTEGGASGRTDLAAIDAKAKIGGSTELRAEVGLSRRDGDLDTAWLVEADYRSQRLDVLAYARSVAPDYGVGQQNRAERGRRKLGGDVRAFIADGVAVTGSVWRDDALGRDLARRDAVQLRGEVRRGNTDARLGAAMFSDRSQDGRRVNSTVLEGGATQRLLGNRLELDASTSIALTATESVDLPARHRLSARYALSPGVKLVGAYELADGEAFDSRSLRAGFELTPWSGARLITTVGSESIAEQGKRSFAAFGLAQSWQVSPALTLDASLDGNRVLGQFDPARNVNLDHPVANGGHLGDGGTLSEDFTAVALGAGYRAGRWSAVVRAEYRDGEYSARRGATFGAIRQLGEGSVVGAGVSWTRAQGTAGATSEVLDAALSAAWRPATSPWAVLGKIEYRADEVSGVQAGELGPVGRSALLVGGQGAHRRLVGSLSVNWSPTGREQDRLVQRSEIGLFLGGRYAFQSQEGLAISGVSALAGLDATIGVTDRIAVGGSMTMRSNVDDHTAAFALGPQIGIVPSQGMLLTLGYNVTGFRDRDFTAARTSDRGLFATLKLKFDTSTLGFLGLAR